MQGPFGGLNATTPGKTPLQNDEKALQNAPSPSDGQGDGKPTDASERVLEAFANEKISNKPAGQTVGAGQRQPGEDQGKASEDVLKAFAQDTGPAADAIQEFLKDPSKEAAEALLNRLPNLLPDDPALEAVLAEAMAAEFRPVPSAQAGGLNREYKRATDGKFSEVDNPTDFKPGKNPDSSETQAAEIGKGKSAITKCMTEKIDVHNAVMRSDLGPIDFIYGDKDGGIAHIVEQHGSEIVGKLPEVLIRGDLGKPYQHGQKRNITHGPYTATVRLDRDGKNEKWVLTLFEKSKEG